MNQSRLFARSTGACALAVSVFLGAIGVVGLASRRAEAAPAPMTIGFIYVGPEDRLRLQPGPRAGCGGHRQAARRQGPRGGDGPRDLGRPEDDGEHDQPRRGDAALPDLVRLLRSAHPQRGQEVHERDLPALRRPVPGGQAPDQRRQLLRLHRRGRVRLGHRGRPDDASRTSSASSPPSRFRRCCATSTRSRWAPSRSTRRSPPPSSSRATGRCRSRRPRPPTA